MADIARLVVNLEAQTATFEAGMRRANQSLDGMRRATEGLQRSMQTITRVAGAFGLALGVGAIAAFINSSVTMAGSLGETAQQLGLTTDALQALRFQAVQDGLTVEQLDTAIIHFNDTLGNASRGADEAARAFGRLGVLINDASGRVRPTEDVLLDVASAISKIRDPALAAAAAGDLFGNRLGARLIPLLSRGSQGFEEFMRQARAAGAIIGADVIEAADRSSDAFERNMIVVRSWAATIGVWAINRLGEFLTALGQLAALFRQVWEAIQGPAALRRLLDDPVQLARDQVNGLTQDVLRLGEAWHTAQALPADTPDRFTQIEHARFRLEERARELIAAREALRLAEGPGGAGVGAPPRTVGAGSTASQSARNLGERIGQLIASMEADLAAIADARDAFIANSLQRLPPGATSAQVDRVRELAAALFDAKEREADFNQAMQDGDRIWEQTRTQAERLTADIADLNYLHNIGAIDADTFGRAVRDAYLKGTSLGQAIDDVGRAFSDAFEAAIVKGESLRNVLGGLLQDIGRLLIRLAVLEPLQNVIRTGLGALFGGIVGGGGSSGGSSGSSRAMGGIDGPGGPIAMAAGGVVSRPHTVLFGEGDMNEAFVPLPDGRRIPVDMRGGGGGNAVVINVDARSADAGVDIKIKAAMQQVAGQILSGITTMSRDGGSFARQTGARKR